MKNYVLFLIIFLFFKSDHSEDFSFHVKSIKFLKSDICLREHLKWLLDYNKKSIKRHLTQNDVKLRIDKEINWMSLKIFSLDENILISNLKFTRYDLGNLILYSNEDSHLILYFSEPIEKKILLGKIVYKPIRSRGYFADLVFGKVLHFMIKFDEKGDVVSAKYVGTL